ncbi:MAG TPA: HD domain-containing protein [Treponemataceae bacterium]|nr:HD domain-containing protein [Treponemataceae bacterium]
MFTVSIPHILKELSLVFKDNGFQVYLVGGAIRDILLNKKADDWDIATDATPEEVSQLFKKIIPTGIAHGTVTIHYKSYQIECTTFRTENGYSDGRRPDSISYTATIEEDLSRRDFTMNAIGISLPDGKLVDPFSGRKDIKASLIKTVGNPIERFSEDGLRPLRAVRFAAQLGFSIEEATLSAIRPCLEITAKVAKERIKDELVKLLCSPKPSIGLRFMEETGLLQLIIPELQKCRGVEQKGMHKADVLDHLYATCDLCPPQIELRLAGLFHDIGKPAVRALTPDGIYTFYNHEIESQKIVERILKNLRFPTKTINTVSHLVRHHMFHYESNWTDAAVRRFIVRTETDYIEPLFALRLADARAISGVQGELTYLDEMRSRIHSLQKKQHAFNLKDLAINGKDLISQGIPAGPKTGLILEELLETVLDEPEFNTREKLISCALEIYKRKLNS